MGSSKSVVVGYRYFMGLHFGVCYGPVDVLKEIRAGDRQAWVGEVTDNETISIDAPSLFGGKKREGGIEGDLDVMMGGPAQTANSYLSDQIEGLMPAFRGILGLVYKGGLISANNPYVKPWAFRVERIKASWEGGTAWNPTKAAIELSEGFVLASDAAWEYQILDHHADPGFNSLSVPEDDWIAGQAPFSSETGGVPDGNTEWPIKTILWTRKTIDEIPPGTGNVRRLYIEIENGCVVFFDGEIVGSVNRENVQTPDGVFNTLEIDLPTGSSFEIAIKCFDEVTPAFGGTYLIVESVIDNFNAMNPAHIVYQCLTDPQWGMGYPTAQIDDDSFTAAAQTFFDEGLGLCLIWNQQSSIEDFVQLVLDHAGAVYYADPKTGKFKLKALRFDYDPDYLPVYDETNIISLDKFERPTYGEMINEITVVYLDYWTAKDSSITVQDLASIQAQGGVISQTRQYPGLPTSDLAARIAERDVIASSTPLAKCRITVNRSAWEEAPGGVIKVNWDKLGLDGVVFRVLTINYGSLNDGHLVIELAEDVYGLPSSSYSIQEPTGFTEPDTAPSVITIQDVAETPYWDLARALTAADLSFIDADAAYIMAMAATANQLSLGFEMFTRISPAEYATNDAFGSFAPTATIGGSTGLRRQDTVLEYENGINIADVVIGQRVLIGTGRFAEFAEITSFGSGVNEIELNRGILDTTPQDHAFGTRLFFIEDDFAVDPTERATGDSVDVKLSAYSSSGETGIELSTAMNIEPDQRLYRPYPAGKIRINDDDFPAEVLTDSSGVTVTWAHRDRLQQLVNYVDQNENSIGPEAGTTYTVRFYLDSVLLDTQSGISGTSASFVYTEDGLARIEVDSVRDSVVNWQSQIREFDVVTEVETDPDFASVVSLIHFPGEDGSTTITDVIGLTWSTTGNVQIDTARSKWGGSSLLCDGTGDYIAHATALLTSAAFTIEEWFWFNALGAGVRTLWSQYLLSDANRTIFDVRNAKLSIFNGAQGLQSGSNDLPTGQWVHIRFVWDGINTCKGYVDGVLEVTHSTFATPANVIFRMGSFDGTGNYFDGSMDDFRCTHAVRNTTDFTPPDGPFPDQ